jgi:hypothetical protein
MRRRSRRSRRGRLSAASHSSVESTQTPGVIAEGEKIWMRSLKRVKKKRKKMMRKRRRWWRERHRPSPQRRKNRHQSHSPRRMRNPITRTAGSRSQLLIQKRCKT